MIRSLAKVVLLAVLVVAGALFMVLGGRRYLTFAALAGNREWLGAMVAHAGAKAA